MARGGGSSIFDRLQVEGSKFLKVVEAEIRERQAELDDLREKANQWLAAMGGTAPKRRGRPPGSGRKAGPAAAPEAARPSVVKKPAKAKRKSPPVDWEKVLGKLPKAFTMDDVAKATPALKEHAQTRVIAVARWSRSGAITKTGPGKYKKVGRKAA